MDDGDSKTQKLVSEESHIGNADARNVLFTLWFRWTFCVNNEMDRFLLDYGFNFLPCVGVLVYLALFFSSL